MNALANSQREEIDKFIKQSGLPDHLRPTFARYTGQESLEERERIREAKPDILLTNFMMLELLMARQNELDRAVMANSHGLDFLVLDELHTYRGRQGADIAMLVRRVRDRLCPDRQPICIGTSATMATEGDDVQRAKLVAAVSSRLFGTAISDDAVIGESLERATDSALKSTKLGSALAVAVNDELPAKMDDNALHRHPLAVWCELEIGLLDGQRLSRRHPVTALEAGMANLQRHVENVKKFGLPAVVSINRFSADTEAEIALVKEACGKLGVEALMADHWAMGGEGAADVARAVVKVVDSGKSKLKLAYPDDMPLLEKVRTIASQIYRAEDIDAPKAVRDQLANFEAMGFGKLPVCIAKTQYSFSTNPDAKGAPEGFTIPVREVRLSAGAV